MRIRMLQAFQGDALLVTFTDQYGVRKNIFIDGGTPKTYLLSVKPQLDALRSDGQTVDLWIVTHTDDDHIGGVLEWFRDEQGHQAHPSLVQHFWVNTTGYAVRIRDQQDNKISARQGISLEQFLIARNCSWEDNLTAQAAREVGNAKLTLLSPTQERLQAFQETPKTKKAIASKLSRQRRTLSPLSDLINKPFTSQDSALSNGASIAFLLEAEGKKALFLGDAWASTIVDSLQALGYSKTNPLELECVQLAHHGSQQNFSPELAALLRSNNYLISSAGKGPDKETFARIIGNAPDISSLEFVFNYDNEELRSLFSEEDRNQYSFKMKFPDNGNFIDVEI